MERKEGKQIREKKKKRKIQKKSSINQHYLHIPYLFFNNWPIRNTSPVPRKPNASERDTVCGVLWCTYIMFTF